ncbi:MAG: EF-P lysine aminoacylase GenX [Pseudomonadales bacterium]|nr:EF-P lysine aminoacylase GenX [Pseudomonadales bacterium]
MKLSDWRPTVSLEAIKLRAELYHKIRGFFLQREVLEVDTAVLSSSATTDPNIESIQTVNPKLFLQTSPEFAMKRLLAIGSGPIFQIAKAFRNEEQGRRHSREFAMLEWYRPGLDYHELMDEVVELMQVVAGWKQIERITYRESFLRYLGIDPHCIDIAELTTLAKQQTGYQSSIDDKDALLDLLMSHVIEAQLGQDGLTFIYDYPASQCALAKVGLDQWGNPVARRFELYAKGVELANGYQELTDWREQERRFEQDNRIRRSRKLPELPIDKHLIAALQQGMPECSGVALGLDRLLMLMLGSGSLEEVI